MTEQEAYKEHIRYTHDTYCRIVMDTLIMIRHLLLCLSAPNIED